VAKLGIFGGTFNPPHLGHLHIANGFLQAFQPEELLIIPSFVPPHKESPDLLPGEERMALCKRTFQGEVFRFSDMELQRKGRSYTVDTLETLKAQHPEQELYFLVGDDMLFYLPFWKDPERLLTLAHFVSAVRTEQVSTAELEQFAKTTYPQQYADGRFHFLTLLPFPVSSTEVREKRKAGQSLKGLVTPETEAYIKEKGFYL